MIMLKFLVTVGIFFLAACGTNQQTGQFKPRAIDDNTAIVYVYRPSTVSNAMYSPELFINDEFRLSIKNGQLSQISLPPGEKKFEIQPEANYSGLTQLVLSLSSGMHYYVRVDTSLKVNNAVTYQPYQRSFNLIAVDADIAVTQIEECCLKDKIAVEKTSSSIRGEPITDDGFSVEKTQNPFSH